MEADVKNLNTLQVKVLSNGCGPKSKFIPVPDFIFTASCDIHDINYIIGGDKTDRKKADKGFYKYMKQDIKNSKKCLIKQYYYHCWAYIYYLAVRMFGGKFFNCREKLTQEQLLQEIKNNLPIKKKIK